MIRVGLVVLFEIWAEPMRKGCVYSRDRFAEVATFQSSPAASRIVRNDDRESRVGRSGPQTCFSQSRMTYYGNAFRINGRLLVGLGDCRD